MLPTHRRILLLTEGRLGVFTSKTAAVLLRYRVADVVGIVDSAFAGARAGEHIPWARPDLPVLARVTDAPTADALYVGVAPVGGGLPSGMRAQLTAALRSGMDVVSGLHERLAADAELARIAAESGARMIDVRALQPPPTVASAAARHTRARRVLTVGTDCNVGKMVTALELSIAARRRGLDARFLATGQTGMMVAGDGVPIDAVVSDFAAGAIEGLVLRHADADVQFIEGQGSLGHPGFSGVTLSLLHGACPDALILVHHAGRTHYRAEPHHPLPAVGTLIDAYERVAALVHPTRVVGVALNAHGCAPAAAEAAQAELRTALRLPVVDPLADGCDALLDALNLSGMERRG